jgi:hypothetical protein
VLGAGLAQLHAHVDEARGEAQPGEVHGFDIAAGRKIGTERRDPVFFDQKVAALIEPTRGIKQPGVAV